MRKITGLLLTAVLSAFATRYEMPYRYEMPHRGEQGYQLPGDYPGAATVDVLSRPLTVRVEKVPFSYLVSFISQEAGVPVILREMPPDRMETSYFSLNKPFRMVLDEITSMHDLWWEYVDGKVEIYRYRSEVFQVKLPFLEKTMDERNAGLSVSYRKNFWNKVEESLKQLIADRGSKLSVNEMGYVFFYGRPSEREAIKKAVERINRDYSREIPLRVRVYLVDDEDFRSIGIGWQFKEGPVQSGLQSQVLQPLFNLSVVSTRIEAEIRARAETGKAKILEDSRMVSLNGQPIYYAPQERRRIISKYEVFFVNPPVLGGQQQPQNQLVVPTVNIITEDIPQGTLLVIVPYYVDEDRIVVDLYRRQDRIEGVQSVSVSLPGAQGQNTINLPQVSTRTNLTQTVLRRGESLMLFSNAMDEETMRSYGIPFLKDIPIIGYLFGTKERTKSQLRLVIFIAFDGEIKEGG